MSAVLDSLPQSIAHLRSITMPLADYRVLPFGVSDLDNRVNGEGSGLERCTRSPHAPVRWSMMRLPRCSLPV